MASKRVVVVGAGVSGLTTALLLSKNSEYEITIAAKHMPGDYDIEYASPWAGADYLPFSKAGTKGNRWESNTWPHLRDLAQDKPEAGIHFLRNETYTREVDLNSPTPKFPSLDVWKAIFPDLQDIPPSQLQPGIASAVTFTTVCINTAIYLPWLTSQCLAAGVIFKRAVFDHVSQAADAHHSGSRADLVVNCTGLSSLYLGGVQDMSMFPTRGQIVLVRNESHGDYSVTGTDDGPDESCYLMQRAAGGGTILGGCSQKGKWESQPDPNLAVRIMKRCVDLCPSLTNGKGIEHLDIVRHAVGLRPSRKGGIRIEREEIEGVVVVHNYGHGGAGYQTSYGCAGDVLQLVDEAFGT